MMIISASRRTDIPAFYTPWFMNRIREGFCTVPNPFNRRQISRISLLPADVDAIVFWTRNPRPLLIRLDELDQQGYRYCFQFTLLDYPCLLDAKTPGLDISIESFRRLSERVGPERIVWRYDPIVLSNQTGINFHKRVFATIAGLLRGFTKRSVISLMDVYRKIQPRLRRLQAQGLLVEEYYGEFPEEVGGLLRFMAEIAAANDIEIQSCAEDVDLRPCGLSPGRCIDGQAMERIFGIQVDARKDPTQRKSCGCSISKDIGMYDTCLYGCQYCYATTSFDRARLNYQAHDPESPCLVGR
jgi:hypothetical protein